MATWKGLNPATKTVIAAHFAGEMAGEKIGEMWQRPSRTQPTGQVRVREARGRFRMLSMGATMEKELSQGLVELTDFDQPCRGSRDPVQNLLLGHTLIQHAANAH
eukprot:gene13249-3871_t